MALPKLNTATYELDLPSTGEKLKYRPWLVKEQKILLMAQESEDDKEMERAFANIVKECTFDEIDPYSRPMFDLEYIFLRLRGKSVGDKIKLNVTCPDDEETKVDVEINLEEVGVQMKEEHTNEISLTDDISIHMRYPNLKDAMKTSDEGEGPVAQVFNMMMSCVAEIHHGDVIHQRVDISEQELKEFLESMNQEDFDKMSNFFDTMPKLQHIIKVKNPKTKKMNEIPIEGLPSFFD